LLGVAPVFDDERNSGRPVYFCDVVVRDDAQFQTFSDLQGSAWTYNDACSLSGYYGLLNKLAESGTDETFFRSVSCSGSHVNSIDAILRGNADVAAVDSNVLRIQLRETPALGKKLRVIESWGPYPIQPVVVNSSLHPEIKQRLRTAFFTTNEDEHTRQTLRQFGLSRFAPVGQQDYSLATHEILASLLSTPKT
jgi:ABC-type phosphate/phosphonate transport system substrate-binding protein